MASNPPDQMLCALADRGRSFASYVCRLPEPKNLIDEYISTQKPPGEVFLDMTPLLPVPDSASHCRFSVATTPISSSKATAASDPLKINLDPPSF